MAQHNQQSSKTHVDYASVNLSDLLEGVDLQRRRLLHVQAFYWAQRFTELTGFISVISTLNAFEKRVLLLHVSQLIAAQARGARIDRQPDWQLVWSNSQK